LWSGARYHSAEGLFCAWRTKHSGIRDDVAWIQKRNELMTGARRTLASGH
jgi:hypothetical protein